MNTPIYTPPLDALVANAVDRLDDALRFEFEERSGVITHCTGDELLHAGNQTRAHAECLALLDLLLRHPYCLSGLTAVEVELDGATQWVLTSNLPFARQLLADIGGNEIAVLDPVDVVRQQYGDVAMLSTLG